MILILSLLLSLNVFAQETGPADSVIRVPAAGGRARAGSIDLSKSAAVGSSVLPMANGGSNKALTAVNGGMCYSDADSLELLAAGSSGQVLRSSGAGAPAWSTATYPSTATGTGKFLKADGTNWVASTATLPDTATGTGTILRADGTNWVATTATYPATTSANQLLYSASSNAVSGLTSAATSALVTNSSSVPSFTSGSTANRLLRTDGTTVSFAQAALTTDVTGTLPVTNGGTGTGTAFTSGSVVFADGSGVYAQDNTNFFWDDANDRLGIGVGASSNTITINGSSVGAALSTNIEGATDSIGRLARRFSASAGLGTYLLGARSRGTQASQTIVSSGDSLLRVEAAGHDGVDYEKAAAINFEVDGTTGSNDMPGRMVFMTTLDGATSLSERMRIANTGYVGIGDTSPDTALDVTLNDATTTTAPAVASFYHNTSGTPGTNFGLKMDFFADSATVEEREMFNITGIYTDATDATRTVDLTINKRGTAGVEPYFRAGRGGGRLSEAYGYSAITTVLSGTTSFGIINGDSTADNVSKLTFSSENTADAAFIASQNRNLYLGTGNSTTIQMGMNNTTNFIGIGSAIATAPANKLHIDAGTGTATYAQFTANATTGQTSSDGLLVGIDSTGKANINQQKSAALGIYTAGTERLSIDSSGNIGIGDTTPDYFVDIYKSAAGAAAYFNISTDHTTAGIAGGIAVEDFNNAGTPSPVLEFYSARGTEASPTTSQSADQLGNIAFFGRSSSAVWDSGVSLISAALETWTTTARGAKLDVYTNPVGSSTGEVVATFASSGVSIQGTNTNDSATAGDVGEYKETIVADATALGLATNVIGDCTSVSLTAGDWDLSFRINFNDNSTTFTTYTDAWLSSTSGNSATGRSIPANYDSFDPVPAGQTTLVLNVDNYRVSLSATTTYYLKCRSTFTGTAPTYGAIIRARRVR